LLKLSENPPILFPNPLVLTEAPRPWWVAHTKARAEKAFAWDLHRGGIPYFLPMIQRVTVSGGRKRTALVPLFNGYVFFSGDRDTRLLALRTDCLCQVIEVVDQGQLRRQLGAVAQVLAAGTGEFQLHPFATLGKRVRVRMGPFMGIEGKVAEIHHKSRLILEISALGQAVSLEIDADLLESCEE
jgi:hypothetical protein